MTTKFKVMTILGTRPEIIRLSLIMKKLDELTHHTVLHTGQNYVPELDTVFFESLRLREPDITLETRSERLFSQVSKILSGVEEHLLQLKPDACLILGDVNSGLSALVAERHGVPVFHMEAGNRCHDYRVPEELNRKVIDHASTWLLPYVPNSRDNLIREGIDKEAIFVSGNPIYEVLTHYEKEITASDIVTKLDLKPGKYFLLTAHRAENVDDPEKLKILVDSMNQVAEQYQLPIIWSCHPRTVSKLEQQHLELHSLIRKEKPFNLFDFVKLEKEALCVISDSGTVQEECCLFHVPSIHIRDFTERPETIQCGSNILTGCQSESVLSGIELAIKTKYEWSIPEDYLDLNVSEKVVRFMLGNINRKPPSRLSLQLDGFSE